MAEPFSAAGVAAVAVSGRQPDETRIGAALADLADGPGQCRLHRRSLQRRRRRSERRHASAPSPNREPDALSPAARARTPKAPERPSARCSTSSGRIGKSSASTAASGRCSAESRATSSDRSQGLPVPAGGLPHGARSRGARIVLRSIREAIPSTWRHGDELRSLGDVSLATYLDETGLELEDVYAGNRSWTDMRRHVGLVTERAGGNEPTLLRAIGRMLHVDDAERLELLHVAASAGVCARPDDANREAATLLEDAGEFAYEPAPDGRDEPSSRGDLVASAGAVGTDRSSWRCLTAERRIYIVLSIRPATSRCTCTLGTQEARSLLPSGLATGQSHLHGRPASGGTPLLRPTLFAFTLDKSVGGFSPTTRYRDYAISPELIHWESQGATASDGPTGQRYIHHVAQGTRSCCSVGCGLTTDHSGAWATRHTFVTRAIARLRLYGGWITAFRQISTRTSPQLLPRARDVHSARRASLTSCVSDHRLRTRSSTSDRSMGDP